MEIAYRQYIIKLFEDDTYTENSSDNKYLYDHVIKFDENSYVVSHHAIQIIENDETIARAILLGAGGKTGIHKNGFIISDDRICFCAGNAIFCLSIPMLDLVWKTIVDDVTAFGIYKMNSDFIIHGELSISRISKEGKIIWQNYGSDIFILHSGKECVKVKKDKIIAQSWDKRMYVYNYEGEVVTKRFFT